MGSELLIELMKQVEEKGLPWEEVVEKVKVPQQLMKLYANSGPVPVTLINNLKKILEDPPQ